jgi:hypothetical protein
MSKARYFQLFEGNSGNFWKANFNKIAEKKSSNSREGEEQVRLHIG